MARSNTGGKPPGFDYTGRRPGNDSSGGHHSTRAHKGCQWQKRATHKAERKQAGPQIAEQLEDTYTHREFMADICTPEQPCDMCKQKAAARSKPANVLLNGRPR